MGRGKTAAIINDDFISTTRNFVGFLVGGVSGCRVLFFWGSGPNSSATRLLSFSRRVEKGDMKEKRGPARGVCLCRKNS